MSPFLALWKARQIRGNLEWTYTLSQAQWGGEPESAGFTGDTYGKTLVTAVSLLGQWQPKGLLFGRGRDPAPRTLPDTEKFFILTYDRLVFFRTEAEMNDCLRETWGILSPGMEPVGDFYEEQKARSRQEPAPSDAGSGS